MVCILGTSENELQPAHGKSSLDIKNYDKGIEVLEISKTKPYFGMFGKIRPVTACNLTQKKNTFFQAREAAELYRRFFNAEL